MIPPSFSMQSISSCIIPDSPCRFPSMEGMSNGVSSNPVMTVRRKTAKHNHDINKRYFPHFSFYGQKSSHGNLTTSIFSDVMLVVWLICLVHLLGPFSSSLLMFFLFDLILLLPVSFFSLSLSFQLFPVLCLVSFL